MKDRNSDRLYGKIPIQRRERTIKYRSNCIDKNGIAADGGGDMGPGQTTSGEKQSGTRCARKNQMRDKYDDSRADAKGTHGVLLTLDKGLKRRADLNSLL